MGTADDRRSRDVSAGSDGPPAVSSTSASEDSWASVGASGDLQLSEAQRRRLGFHPGARFSVQPTLEGVLLSPADPPLAKLYVEPTSACNLACRACVRSSWDEPTGMMEMATYHRLVDGLRAVPSLRAMAFWGFGEPLLHPQILEMLALAKTLGARTELVTNGLLLDKAMAEGLLAVGLDTLVVSVDGTTPEAYADARSGASLRLVQENLSALRRLPIERPDGRPEIGLEFVLMRRNVGELPRLPRLAQEMGASFVVVTNLLPYTEELKDEILYGLWAGTGYSLIRSRWAPEIMLPRMDVQRESASSLVALFQRIGVIGPQPAVRGRPYGFCRFVGEGAAAVAWDGGVSPCVALMHSYRCYVMGREKQIRRWVVGNVAQDAISELWQRDPYVQFRARVQSFDFAPCTACGGCPMADTNEEDCYGNPFPVCGDCLWAKGVILCP